MSIKTEDSSLMILPNKEEVSHTFKNTPEMLQFIGALKILEETLDEETSQLEQHNNPDYADIHIRKARGIRMLSRIMSTLAVVSDENTRQEVKKQLTTLQKKLTRNSEILKMHLDAVSSLVDTLREVQGHHEADGTYNPFSINMKHING